VKVVPIFFCDSTVRSPPKAVEIILLIESPSPHPSLFKFLSFYSLEKWLNILSKLSLSIPTPVSSTFRMTSSL
jgi:hypothetical protein